MVSFCEAFEETNVDGIMIGRAAIGYPWIFREIKHYFATGELQSPPTIADRVAAARNHLIWSVEWKGERQGVLEMRRHYANYFKGLPNFKEHRQRLVTLDSAAEIVTALEEIVAKY